MKLYDLVKKNPIVDKFSALQYSNFTVALKIAKLKKEIKEKVEFYSEQELSIANTFGEKDSDGKLIVSNARQIKFATLKDAQKFNELISKLRATDTDIDCPIKLNIKKDIVSDNLSLTPDDILMAEGLIEITLDEEK